MLQSSQRAMEDTAQVLRWYCSSSYSRQKLVCRTARRKLA